MKIHETKVLVTMVSDKQVYSTLDQVQEQPDQDDCQDVGRLTAGHHPS